jgi:hypothetical protein
LLWIIGISLLFVGKLLIPVKFSTTKGFGGGGLKHRIFLFLTRERCQSRPETPRKRRKPNAAAIQINQTDEVLEGAALEVLVELSVVFCCRYLK